MTKKPLDLRDLCEEMISDARTQPGEIDHAAVLGYAKILMELDKRKPPAKEEKPPIPARALSDFGTG